MRTGFQNLVVYVGEKLKGRPRFLHPFGMTIRRGGAGARVKLGPALRLSLEAALPFIQNQVQFGTQKYPGPGNRFTQRFRTVATL
jgi:hypothetical protein